MVTTSDARSAADPDLTAQTPPGVLADRVARLAAGLHTAGADVALIGTGADMRYFLGHSVASHERFTCLAVLPGGEALLLVPALERAGWNGTAVEQLGWDIPTWLDGQDPYAVLAELLQERAGAPRVLAVDYYLPSLHALGMRAALPGSELILAGEQIGELRMRKDDAEVAALAAAGAAIDRVHLRIGEWLRPGRTETEVAADIADALLAEGHEQASFVIVGSGPNGASPHHDASARVIQPGDPVVIDIGGPTPAGYFSDCTRTYLMGGGEPDPDLERVYQVVRQAQQAGVDAAVAGAACEAVDAASRKVIQDAGFGDYFITRTGHGIGLEVHEHPYQVAGNTRLLEPGMAFSVEPGIYLPGRFGVRIEDIVVIDAGGRPRRLNTCPTELITLSGD